MAIACFPPHYSLFGDRLLEFPYSCRSPRSYLLGRTFSGAAVALGPAGEVYITGGLVNGHDSKAIYQWKEGLIALGDLLSVRNHHSAVCYQGSIYLVGGGMPIERFSLENRTSKVVEQASLYTTSVCIHKGDQLVIFGRRLTSEKYIQLHIFSLAEEKIRQIGIPKNTKALSQAFCFSLDQRSVVLCAGFKEGQTNCDTFVFDSLKERLEQLRFEIDWEGYREPVRVQNDHLIAVDITGMRHVFGLQGLRWELKKDIYGPDYWVNRRFALFLLHNMRVKRHKITQRLPWEVLHEAILML